MRCQVLTGTVIETPFLLKRLLFNLASLFLTITCTFFFMQWVPGDPFADDHTASHEIHETLLKIHGLQDTWWVQYGRYLDSILKGNLGTSLKYSGRTVNKVIRDAFPISLLLGASALAFAFAGGIMIGTFAALHHQGWQDHLLKIVTAIGISVPSFILGIILQFLLATKWGFFPVARWGSLEQMILPALSLGLAPFCYICKLVRANLIEVLKQDYMKTAYAKGLSQMRTLMVHGLRNALIPLLPYFGQLVANILVGSFVIEKIFSIPGLGQWFVTSVNNRDYPMIMGLTVFYSSLLMSILFMADVASAFLDPRLKQSQR
jgi:oligopeptide transport system permease protein